MKNAERFSFGVGVNGWRLDVFRDPLSNQISRARVYHTSLVLLSDGFDVSGD